MARPPKSIPNCIDCGVKFDEDNKRVIVFGKRLRLLPRCQECNKKYYKKYHPNATNKYREKMYGISLEQYNKLFEFQQGGCAICRKPSERSLDVDHNHQTNEVRGLLCSRCNMVIGLIQEDEDLIIEIIEYLKRTTWKSKAS
jgi:hypothetical protein